MTLSSVFVVANSLRLQRYHVEREPDGRSRVTVSSESRLPDDAVTAALDEAGGYQITPG